MPNYQSNYVPGGTYFFTVNLLDRREQLLTRHIDNLRSSVRKTLSKNPFRIDAWVVLPDHMHCIWTLPEGDYQYSERWRSIKKDFSKSIPAKEYRTQTRIRRNERGIWQRRFWEHTIKDEQDYLRHLDYIHYNPVKHGLVQSVSDWPYSTFHLFRERGFYDADWGLDVCLNVGERV